MHEVRIFHRANAAKPYRVHDGESGVASIDLSPCRNYLLTTCSHGHVGRWLAATGRLLHYESLLRMFPSRNYFAGCEASSGRWSPTGLRFVVVFDGIAYVAPASAPFRVLRQLEDGDPPATAAAWVGRTDGRLVTAHRDGLKFWPGLTGGEKPRPTEQTRTGSEVTSITGSRTDLAVFAVSVIGPPELYFEKKVQRRPQPPSRASGELNTIQYIEDGSVARRTAAGPNGFFGSFQRHVARYNPDGDMHNVVVRSRGSRILAIAASGDGSDLFIGDEDGVIERICLAGSRPPALLFGHAGPVNCLAAGYVGGVVYSGGDDGTVRRWAITEPAAARREYEPPPERRLDI